MDVFPFNVVKLGSFLQGHFVPQNGDGLELGSSRDRKFSIINFGVNHSKSLSPT